MGIPDKLYTVEDIAQMTSLTSRTIRNYLKDGSLKGRKIGGQWRFTQQDIEKLMENGEFAGAVSQQTRRDVLDFLDGVNTDMQGEFQVCTIADIYCAMDTAERKTQRLNALIAEKQEYLRMSFEYIEAEQKARYTLFGAPGFIAEVLHALSDPT